MKPAALFFLFFFASLAAYAQTLDRQLYLEAEGWFQRGDYELALDRYTRLVQEYPLSQYVPDAQFRRAVSLFELARYPEALALFQTVEAHYGFTRYLSYVPFWIGLSYYHLARWKEAIAAFDRYLAEKDRTLRSQALLYKSVAERRLGLQAEERATLDRLVAATSDPASEPYAVAELCSLELRDKRYPRVLELVSKVRLDALAPEWRERIQLYQAEAYSALGQVEKAKPIYEQLLKAEPAVAGTAFERLFAIYQESGDESRLGKIVTAADVALAGMPAILKSFWLRIGIDSYERGRYEVAESYLERIWGQRGSGDIDPLVPLYLAEIEVKLGRVDRAIATLEAALGSEGRSPLASDNERQLILYRLGGLYLEKGEWTLARKEFAALVSSYPDSTYRGEAGYGEAYAAYQGGDYAAALAIIDSLSPGTSPTTTRAASLLRLKADVYGGLGDRGRAIEALRQYSALEPGDSEARVDRVKLLFEQGDWVSVLSESAKILSDFPDLAKSNPSSYLLLRYLRGLVLVTQKSYAPAVEAFSSLTAKALDESSLGVIAPYVLFYRGWALYRLGSYPQASVDFRQLADGHAGSPFFAQALYLSGWCAYLQGQFAAAEGWFVKYGGSVAADSEDQDRGQFMYAKSLAGAKRDAQAALAYQDIFAEHPRSPLAPQALFEYASLLEHMDRSEEAAAALARLAESYPSSPLASDALFKRGEIYYHAGDWAGAERAFSLYRSRFPDGKESDGALYWGGRAALAKGDDYQATLLWGILISRYPESPFRADSMVRSAAVYEKQGDLHRALDLYDQIVALYPNEATAVSAHSEAAKIRYLLLGQSEREAELLVTIGKDGSEREAGRKAMLELAQIYLSGDQRAEALPLLHRLVAASAADPASAARAQYLIGSYWAAEGDTKRAANEFLKAATIDPSDGDLTASAMYHAAELAERSGDYAGARSLVSQIERSFPDTEWATAGRRLIGRGE